MIKFNIGYWVNYKNEFYMIFKIIEKENIVICKKIKLYENGNFKLLHNEKCFTFEELLKCGISEY